MSVKYFRPHILVMVALTTVVLSGWHPALRNALTDLRFGWDQRPASGEIAVIAIDAPSIEAIGVWPWPRQLHAQLLQQLQRAGAQDIAFDVDFSAASTPASDESFSEALRTAGDAVILPAFKQSGARGNDRAAIYINRPLPQFQTHSWPAVVNVAGDTDGRVRRYRFGERFDGEFMPSMAAVLAGQSSKKDQSFLIDFGISAASLPTLSYIDVLRGDPATLARLKDKRLIIGGTAIELGDRFTIPTGQIISGPVLQALAAESILQKRMLGTSTDAVTLAGLAIIVLIMIASRRRLTAGQRVLLLAVLSGAIEFAAWRLHVQAALDVDTSLLQIALAVYVAATALDEIDFRGLIGRIAENRFQRIAMSLGDGLVCTNGDFEITVWNPGATAIFGYAAADVIGKPFALLTADGAPAPFALGAVTTTRQSGTVIEFEGRRMSGEVFPVEASFSAWQGADGLQYGAILRDISIRKREAAHIRYLAEYDTLTGLINRNTLLDRLDETIAAGGEAESFALLVIGLDRFQQINDMLGHAHGDRVLRAVSDRLRAEIGERCLVARLSSDEFAVAMPCAALGSSIDAFVEHLVRTFDRLLEAGARQYRVKVSVGVGIYPEAGQTAEELLSNSHLALCRAKALPRGNCVVFEAAIRQELEARLTLETELALAIERQEFELFYQPQVDLLKNRVVGGEALIRWRHPTRGLVPPGDFIPVVNTSWLSEAVANWVLETACHQARTWELAGHAIRVGINLSPSQLHADDLAETIARMLSKTGLSPALLELEVTEDILLLDEQRVLDIFRRIQDLGVRIVFDDFGTGYASLSYLKKFPLDGLKIDRSFVIDLIADSDDAAIVSSTIGLSRQLGLSVIAEGIENEATAELLLRLGCEQGQGYFFGRPMPVDAFESKFLNVPAVMTEQRGAA